MPVEFIAKPTWALFYNSFQWHRKLKSFLPNRHRPVLPVSLAFHRRPCHFVSILIDDRKLVATEFLNDLYKRGIFLSMNIQDALTIIADTPGACMYPSDPCLPEFFVSRVFDHRCGDDQLLY